MKPFAVALIALMLAGCGSQSKPARVETPPPIQEKAVALAETLPKEPTAPEPAPVSFSRDVQPILTASCVACHSPKGIAAKYDLTSYNEVYRLTVGGNADASKLFTVIKQGKMPPSGKLEAGKLALFRDWINQGARNN